MSRDVALAELLPMVQVAEALAQKYDVVVTNPPYMGLSNGNLKLNNYVKRNILTEKLILHLLYDKVHENVQEKRKDVNDKYSSLDVIS